MASKPSRPDCSNLSAIRTNIFKSQISDPKFDCYFGALARTHPLTRAVLTSLRRERGRPVRAEREARTVLDTLTPDQTRSEDRPAARERYSPAANSLRHEPVDSCPPARLLFQVPNAQIEYRFARLRQVSPAVRESLPANRARPGPGK